MSKRTRWTEPDPYVLEAARETHRRMMANVGAMYEALHRILKDLREQEETGMCDRMRIQQIVDIAGVLKPIDGGGA